MKIKIIALIMIICLLFAGCGSVKVQEEQEEDKSSMFILVERHDIWSVVYHKDTKVMYTVSTGNYNNGIFTLLVDENGNPMLWEG